MRKLFLFTASYPYGYNESFLETEIKYISKQFDEVYIIPFMKQNTDQRDVPNNCYVFKPIVKSKAQQYIVGLFCGVRALKIYSKDFFENAVYLNLKRFKAWFISYAITNNYLHSRQVKQIVTQCSISDVFYSYWGKGGNSIFPFLGDNVKKVSRFHGEWDLWEESSGEYAPVRKMIAKSLDLAIFIAQRGEDYFVSRYPYCMTLVSRLGTVSNSEATRSNDGIIRVLSCSSIIPLKRVYLIFDALQQMDNSIQVEWTHIGDGPGRTSLEFMISKSRNCLKVNLLGQMPNSSVLEYYYNNVVDIFINVSTIEGIPVSIMEAISFDIPVVATNVGGNSEIVNSETGVLLSKNPTPQEIGDAILNLIDKKMRPKVFWNSYYNADINYLEFSRILYNL